LQVTENMLAKIVFVVFTCSVGMIHLGKFMLNGYQLTLVFITDRMSFVCMLTLYLPDFDNLIGYFQFCTNVTLYLLS